MLKGEYSHNIDAKGRLIIPAKFRDDLGEHFVITKGMENCLYVYPEAEWTAFEEKLNALPTTTDKKARAFAYFFQGSAADGDLDKQGRTLIPSVLRTRPDGMKRMLKWSLTLKILHLIWKKADSVSRGRRYGIRTQISITE